MTYDEFIEYIKDRANKELYYDHYDFYPEGYRANDPAISEMIKKCNTMYCNSDTDCLVSDFLILRGPKFGIFLTNRFKCKQQ